MAYSKFDHNPPILVKIWSEEMILTIIKDKNLENQ